MALSNPTVLAALYAFADFSDFSEQRQAIYDFCAQLGIKGTLLLAAEGINGTIAGSEGAISQLLAHLKTYPALAQLDYKLSYIKPEELDKPAFYRLKVKLKKEIVTLGVPTADPRAKVGQYVEAKDWDALVNADDVVLIDTRNTYETKIGKFRKAIDPQTENFREFPEYVAQNLLTKYPKDQKIAMYCTGGIRCEKATAYLLDLGYEQVYHLKGGILKYLETVPEAESSWEGQCFVFDNRVAVKHDLSVGDYIQCHACRHPVAKADLNSEAYIPGVQCPNCVGRLPEATIARAQARQRQCELAAQRGEHHIGRN